MTLDKRELLERYEIRGAERDYVEAKLQYEQALAKAPDARLVSDFGYLLYAHARNELRHAVALYEQAIELDPDFDKPHYELIAAQAALEEPMVCVVMYEERVANSPGDVREHRFLAKSYLTAQAHQRAHEIVDAGLAFAPDDAALVALRGEAKAGLGDTDGALADWRRAVELEPEDIGALYSSAFLLERLGRIEQAITAWRSILAWCEGRGENLEAEWPRRELDRLRHDADGASPAN
jgi:tetratricopeptide (TPR) repeat protein